MGTQIDDIVVVNITRETAAITRVGFGTGAIVGIHVKFAEDFKEYTDQEAVLEDFVSTDEEAIASARYFSQALSPEKVVIGKRVANVSQSEVVTVDNVQNTVTHTVTISGPQFDTEIFTFLSDADATADEITLGLVTDINLGTTPITATDNVDGTFDLDADVTGQAFTVVVTDDGTGLGLSAANAIANVSIATELARLIQAGMTDWYALGLTRRATEAEQLQDIEEAADFIEPLSAPHLFIAATDQASILTAVATDIASILQAKSYDRTAILYSTDESSYPEFAWMGGQLPKDAGSITWKFKTLVGITADQFTDTEVANLKSKNANFYETIAGQSIISSEAQVVGGEYIDVIRGADELQTRIGEDVFTELIRADKIPYTNQGIGVIESTLRAALQVSVDRGFLSNDPGAIVVIVPDIDAIADADKAVRFLQGIEFTAVLAGAIHKVQINGKLTL